MLRVGIDVGGTFTDLFAWRAGGAELRTAKVMTTPNDLIEGVLEAVEVADLELGEDRDDRPWQHDGDERADRAHLPGARVHYDGGFPRHDRDGPPAPRAPLRSLPAAARPARAAHEPLPGPREDPCGRVDSHAAGRGAGPLGRAADRRERHPERRGRADQQLREQRARAPDRRARRGGDPGRSRCALVRQSEVSGAAALRDGGRSRSPPAGDGRVPRAPGSDAPGPRLRGLPLRDRVERRHDPCLGGEGARRGAHRVGSRGRRGRGPP